LIQRFVMDSFKVMVFGGNMLSDGIYNSPRGDLAADYHDYCYLNALDPHEVQSAESFLKQIKMEQKLKSIEEDFKD